MKSSSSSSDSPPGNSPLAGLAKLHNSPIYVKHLLEGVDYVNHDLKSVPSLHLAQPASKDDTRLALILAEYYDKGYVVKRERVYASFPIFAVPKKGSD